ncbi:MAG TPA: DUF1848 domain-containing protein [Tepidisphaeraceae bacterium]
MRYPTLSFGRAAKYRAGFDHWVFDNDSPFVIRHSSFLTFLVIISASYKTDIPAFYGQWFTNRLRAGYCLMRQPFNHRTIRVSLLPEDIDGFVFWTKNLGPFFKFLPDIRSINRPFIVQYTINAYPRQLEASVISPNQSIEHVRRLAVEFGPRVCVWRYDPILFSSLTNIDFHRRNFARLADQLRGLTDEVIISYAHYYRKTQINLRRATPNSEFTWQDPCAQIKRDLTSELSNIASANGMRLNLCSQPEYRSANAGEARCIDATRLGVSAEEKGNRPSCRCHACRDIGEYDTCPHGCIYCYAVNNHQTAKQNYQNHNSEGEFLFSS